MVRYAHDLAISAVSFDSMLVSDLSDRLESRLRTSVAWSGGVARSVGEAEIPLAGDSSRVALVLHQRLWGHNGTKVDIATLRARLHVRPGSAIVVSLDDTPLPDWLAVEPTCQLSVAGLEGVARFVFDAIASAGGTVQDAVKPVAANPAVTEPLRYAGASAFLSQLRAQSVLRRELDALGEELESRLRDINRSADHPVEVTTLPNRFTARLGEIGLSFSWVAGRTGTVEDGRLLVIAWRGVAAGTRRGNGAFTAATPIRERVYHAEATDPGSWRWRDDGPGGRACSTASLVGDAVECAWVDLEQTRTAIASTT